MHHFIRQSRCGDFCPSRLTRLEELETLIGGDQFATYSKKMQSALKRENRKMFRNLNGMRIMNRLPECLVVVDPKKEKNAVREARKMGITTVALIDTDCDPDEVDLPIPGNDDSIRSIELIIAKLADAVLAGRVASGQLKHDVAAGQASAPADQAAADVRAMAGDLATEGDKAEADAQPVAAES